MKFTERLRLGEQGRGRQVMRRRFWATVTVLVVAAATTALAAGGGFLGPGDDDRDDDQERERYAIGIWGDLPYSDVQAQTGVPNLIADMNLQDLAFTAHDGDLKAGNGISGSTTPTTCADALYLQGLAYLNSLRAPAMFTPGDNDWTDCDRAKNGGFNSLERLDHERAVFFSTSFSLGQHRIHQEVQQTPLCLGVGGPVPCVENRRWTLGGNAADIAWLQETFAKAKERNSAAIMLITQADPGFDGSDGTRAPVRDPKTLAETDNLPASDPAAPGPAPDGFHDFLVALRQEVDAFEKPVAYVHGDSHYFRVDKPFLDAKGRRLENFTRVETFGDNVFSADPSSDDNNVHWVKVFVDPRSREVFSYQAQMVPGNRVAVPAP